MARSNVELVNVSLTMDEEIVWIFTILLSFIRCRRLKEQRKVFVRKGELAYGYFQEHLRHNVRRVVKKKRPVELSAFRARALPRTPNVGAIDTMSLETGIPHGNLYGRSSSDCALRFRRPKDALYTLPFLSKNTFYPHLSRCA